jgi:hypothetical protein
MPIDVNTDWFTFCGFRVQLVTPLEVDDNIASQKESGGHNETIICDMYAIRRVTTKIKPEGTTTLKE